MYQAVLQANPKLKSDPQTAFQAVDDMIGQLKGVDQSDKNLILQQNRILQIQFQMAKDAADNLARSQNTDKRVGATERGQDLSHEDRQAAIKASLERTSMQQQGADRRTALTASTKLQAEAIMQAGADHRTDEVTAQRQAAVDAGLDMKEWQTQVAAQLKEEGMSDAFVTKLFNTQTSGAAQGAGPAAPKRTVPKPLPNAPRRGGGGSAGGMSPADIQASVQGAKAAIKANPAAKAAILKHATDSGVPAQALAGL